MPAPPAPLPSETANGNGTGPAKSAAAVAASAMRSLSSAHLVTAPAASLAVHRFVTRFYGDARPERRADVLAQLAAVQTDTGAKDDQGRPAAGLTAGDVDALCLHLVENPPKKPESAIVLFLRRAADKRLPAAAAVDARGDLPSEALKRREAEARDADERAMARRRDAARVWMRANPERTKEITAGEDRRLGIAAGAELTDFQRQMREAAILKAVELEMAKPAEAAS